MAGVEGGRPGGELEPRKNHHEAEGADTTLSRLMQEGVFDKLSAPHRDYEHAAIYWPIKLMSELEFDLQMKAYREGRIQRGEKSPEKKSIEKVRMAYEIIAYPQLDQDAPGFHGDLGNRISDALEHPGIDTEEHPNRAPIALNDAEVRTLSRLTQAMELPFDPDKHTYRYADLASAQEANWRAFTQSERYRKITQNPEDEGMVRDRDSIEERIRLRQVEWDVEDAPKPPSKSNPPEPEK
jgi:hypothetical protein